MSFVGSLNPAKKIPLMINITKRMVNICRERSEITFVDTTGLVGGDIGKALKIGKIRAIKPEHIIAIQRYDELEHILTLIGDTTLYRIRASRMARARDREKRIRYRKKIFLDYFKETKVSDFLLHERDAGFFCNDKPLNLKDGDFKEGTIIGLNRNDDTIALGIVVEVSDDSIIFKSPIKSLRGINRVVFGDIETL